MESIRVPFSTDIMRLPESKTGAALADKFFLPAPVRSRWASDNQEFYTLVPLPFRTRQWYAVLCRGVVDFSDHYAAITPEALLKRNGDDIYISADGDDLEPALAELFRDIVFPESNRLVRQSVSDDIAVHGMVGMLSQLFPVCGEALAPWEEIAG